MSSNRLRIGIAQSNPCVGDIRGNLALALRALRQAAAQKADLLLFSELFLSGYSPEDLLLKPAFLQACEEAASELAAETAKTPTALLIGCPVLRKGQRKNAVLLLEKGKITAERHKMDLPNYAEFDEKRVFSAGKGALSTAEPLLWHGIKLGLPICEDIWNNARFCQKLAAQGAELILSANASPYSRGKAAARLKTAQIQVQNSGLPLIYANQFGGQDELVFDGGSFALDGSGALVCRLKAFAEDIAITEWQKKKSGWHYSGAAALAPQPEGDEADYTACMIGLRDYMAKNGFKKALLGMSGGIDSALCAAMAADAVGAENVTAIMLPYRWTGSDSLHDAELCAQNIGCIYESLPINAAVEAAASTLAPMLEKGAGLKQLEAQVKQGKSFLWLENVQSRMRGLLLMAVSNAKGSMLITTGNKSEMAVGFATLYGDMNGGFNPIKDVYKMQVYALSRWRNAHCPQGSKLRGKSARKTGLIPQSILDKAPSAELSEGQRDEDRLPPYPILDAVLRGLVEEELDCAAVAGRGYNQDVVERVEHLLYIAEYKRRQAAPGVKLSAKAFGKLRRYPIANRFRTAGSV